MFRTKKTLGALVTAFVVAVVGQLALALPAHAEEVCVPVDLRGNDITNFFLWVCVGTDADSGTDEPVVWAYVLYNNEMPLGTGVLVDTDEPRVYGGVWSWTQYERRAEVVVEVDGTDGVSVCIDTYAPLPEVHECVEPIIL